MLDLKNSSASSPENEATSSEHYLSESARDAILASARERGQEQNLMCAGALTPDETWTLAKAGEAIIVDIRTQEEFQFVGRVPNSPNVPWMCGLAMVKNPSFINEVEKMLSKSSLIVLICRSGQRSIGAAEAMTRAGYTAVYNMDEGFEGTLDENRQRGAKNGWRHRGLPWLQD